MLVHLNTGDVTLILWLMDFEVAPVAPTFGAHTLYALP